MTGRILILVAALVLLCACGTPGAPRPPSLRLAETVRDLAASRQGSTVTLTWTMPQRTTDGENLRTVGSTLVCMGIDDFPMTHCDQAVADLSSSQFAQCAPKIGQPATCQVAIPFELQRDNPKGLSTFAIEVLNTNGRSAGLSNQVRVPLAPTAEPIPEVSATVSQVAVVVKFVGFDSGTYTYHVIRSETGSKNEVDLGQAHQEDQHVANARVAYAFSDQSFEWEKTYLYRVIGVTTVNLPNGEIVDVRGDPTPDVKVFTHDVFPPAPPSGLQAVASGVGQQPFVDLSWAPNTEGDLAGYNVYRHEESASGTKTKIVDSSTTKLTLEPVKAPSYRDTQVQRGTKYFYLVTAVDLRGNESSKSQEASETVH